MQAMSGNHVTNQLHQSINLSEIEKMMIQNLDGTNGATSLAEQIYAFVESGKIELKDKEGKLISEKEAATAILQTQCRYMLEIISRKALLVE